MADDDVVNVGNITSVSAMRSMKRAKTVPTPSAEQSSTSPTNSVLYSALAAGGGGADDGDEAASTTTTPAPPALPARPSPMSAVMPGQEYVAGLAYDLETTSLDPETTEVVQIAIVAVNSRTPDDPPTFTRLVLPEGPIEAGAAAVHGYTRERLIEEGARPFEEVSTMHRRTIEN